MSLLRRQRNGLEDELSRDWLREVAIELERGRRYERPFVLIRVPLEGQRGRGGQPDHCRRMTSAVRRIDRCWLAAGSLYFLLPESSRDAGEGLLTRMREHFPELPLHEAQMACFPDDAVTAGALLDAVQPDDSAVEERGRPLKQLMPAAQLRRLRDASGGT